MSFKKLSYLLFSFALLFLFIFPSSIFAATDTTLFGITGTESGKPNALPALGVKMIYTWSQGAGGSVNAAGYTTLNTIRLGSYWWGHSSQNFYTLSGNPSCDKLFGVPGTYQYNECTIVNKINSIYASISNQSPKYIVIGNEPNIPGSSDSDGTVPAGANQHQYIARQYNIIYSLIKAYHPDVYVIGPSILGYTPGMNNGAAWFSNFRSQYISMYGITPPMDYLNYHAYNTQIDSGGHRSLDWTATLADLDSYRTGMDSYGYGGKGLFITEFGVLNHYGTANSPTAIREYLGDLITGFRDRKVSHNLKGWMLFSESPSINPVTLFDGSNNITLFGQFYQKEVTQTIDQQFNDVYSTTWGYDSINKLAFLGISTGYAAGAPYYKEFRPSDQVLRSQMALFLARTLNLQPSHPFTNFVAPGSPSFVDVPNDGSETYKAVEFVKAYGISPNGCGGGYFCATSSVLRSQMALFLSRTLNWDPTYPFTQPFTNFVAPGSPSFVDVPNDGSETYKAVEFIKARGITTGNGGYFNPNNVVTRDQMAVFLMRAFPYPYPF